MNVMRFVGKTAREAMRQLRETLGADALILANRPCAEGVEIIAAPPGAIGVLPGETAPGPMAPGPMAPIASSSPASGARGLPPSMSTVSFQDYVRQRLRDRARGVATQEPSADAPARLAASAQAAVLGTQAEGLGQPLDLRGSTGGILDTIASPAASAAAAPGAPSAPAAPSASVAPSAPFVPAEAPRPLGVGSGPASGPIVPSAMATPALAPQPAALLPLGAVAGTDALMAELQQLRGAIAQQFATMSWFEGVRRSPVQGRLLRTMVAAGFSLKLARTVVARLPSDFGERDASGWLEAVIARNLRCTDASEVFAPGSVCALVGPTGVGKTTTTAKIAARHVMAHGAQSVALITVDTYRLGAHDQLRAFGRILGVPVHVAHDASALYDLLRLRGGRQLVLIDTVGLGHRDERIGSLLMSLPRAEVRHVVVASSAAQAETLDESLRAYQAKQAAGVVLTKTDEAARLGGALDCLVRQRVPLLGVCDGQRVPEDWRAADALRLVRQALLPTPAGAFALHDEELPLVFGVAATRQGEGAHA
jgi:flagellar biosynthesis protein FlhF